MAETQEYSLDILSATWGTADVTKTLRGMYVKDANTIKADNNLFTISPTVALFGDPIPNQTKVLVCVWRVILSNGSLSAIQATTIKQSETGTINYDGSHLPSFVAPTDKNKVFVAKAYWHTLDVTAQVQALADNVKSSAQVSIAYSALKASDPAPNTLKALVITYGYVLANGEVQFAVSTATDTKSAVFNQGPAPPRLLIKSASFGGVDWTSKITPLINPITQTISVDNYGSIFSDPWKGVYKTLAVLYQYENSPLQLLIAWDTNAAISISPSTSDPARSRFFNLDGRRAGETNIIAVVWGIMQGRVDGIAADRFKSIKELGTFGATNKWFGFDGWTDQTKSATVFYQYGLTGEIKCVTAREGERAVPLAPRHPVHHDPLPGRGLLATSSLPGDGFTLQVPDKKHWLSIDYPSLTVLSTTTDSSAAAVFRIQRDPPGSAPVMTVTDPKRSPAKYYYVQCKGEADGDFVNLLPTRDGASEAYYELPAGQSFMNVLFGFGVDGGARQDPRVFRLFPGNATARSARVQALPIFYDTPWVPDDEPQFSECLFQPEFTASHSAVHVSPRDDPIAPPIPKDEAACLFGIATLLLDLLYSVPNAAFGWFLSIPGTEPIVRWMRDLDAAKQTLIADLVDGVKSLFAGGAGNGTSVWSSAFSMANELYNAGLLWGFYKAIFSSFSILEYGVLFTQFAAWAIAQVAAAPALAVLEAVQFVLVVTRTITHIQSAARSCAAIIKGGGKHNTPARQRFARLQAAVQGVVSEIQGSELHPSSQLALIKALRGPHVVSLLAADGAGGGQGRDVAELRKRALVPLLEADDEPVRQYLQRTARLDQDVLELVDTLAPQVDAALAE
ncbi:hypothetical protein B0T26DRAFT_866335 [Lasiosphaeria miniovina]|uniref:Uncharacterized protein n=1 Tax=Lasiosphaeria miniovina TaxID=1954250 RepID=A0AA40E951_9PEZI|nr:uncharacterized protein B0T26DRAFT_866335 [Lasiosphaeria miniovina]KAK0732934.1 hypothetical protein B0T26DRAFT_866335 [Lasiosphaeria miniovina]